MKQSMVINMSRLTGLSRQLFGKLFWHALGLVFASASTCLAIGPAPALPAPVVPAPTFPLPAVKVGVYAKHVGSKIVYFYRIVNKSQQDITAVSVGYNTMNDEDPFNDVWELTELPSGWNPKLGIPATSSNSPTGWRVSMTTPGINPPPGNVPASGNMPTPGEESKTHAITWEIVNNKSPVITGGQTMAKMSIALDKADINYLTGHALITFADDSPPAVSKVGAKTSPAAATTDSPAAVTKSPPLNFTVSMEALDTNPPALSLIFSPSTIWSPEIKYIPINVTFAKKEDDFDNLPEIKLESITANEPLEPDDIRDASYGMDDRYIRLLSKHNGSTDRIYTLTYSATDASGNQTFSSGTVTISATAPVTAIPTAAPHATTPAVLPPPVTAPVPAPPRNQAEKNKVETKSR